jgi:flagellar hook assembly protein FlgD
MYRWNIMVGAEETGCDKQRMFFSAYPNPSHREIEVQYELNNAGSISIRIFDPQGRLVNDLVNANQAIGLHSAVWNGKDQKGIRVPGGVYFCKLTTGDQTLIQKLIIVE